MSRADEGGLIGRIQTGALMVALEETHSKMLAVIPASVLGEMVIVAREPLASALGPVVLLNGRRVRVDRYSLYRKATAQACRTEGEKVPIAMCPAVYLVRDADLQENQRRNA